MIAEGRITVNDRTVEEVGTIIDESKDIVKVDGTTVAPVEHKVYLLLNKPPQVMTTLHDPFKRKTVVNYLKDLPTRVYPVGRLDFDTEGVLLLTNDGDLAYRLAHPRYQIPKIYEARVKGYFKPEHAQAIKKGIKLDDGAVGHADVAILGYSNQLTKIRLTLTEGRKREVKQLCKSVGHPVKQLRRVVFAGITARGLKLGRWRYLTNDEVEKLRELAKMTR
jgi:pseudouridine synthase